MTVKRMTSQNMNKIRNHTTNRLKHMMMKLPLKKKENKISSKDPLSQKLKLVKDQQNHLNHLTMMDHYSIFPKPSLLIRRQLLNGVQTRLRLEDLHILLTRLEIRKMSLIHHLQRDKDIC